MAILTALANYTSYLCYLHKFILTRATYNTL
jgi:hypothetical protein